LQPVCLDGSSFHETRVFAGREHLRRRIGVLSFPHCIRQFQHYNPNIIKQNAHNSAKATYMRRRFWTPTGNHMRKMMMQSSPQICEASKVIVFAK
jgi:hypothetical protein